MKYKHFKQALLFKVGSFLIPMISQIEAKHYADAFKMSGKKVVKIGLNFSVKDEVNSLEWKIG